MKKIIFIILISAIAIMLNAEIISNAFKPTMLMPSFLNSNNLSMNHSVSFFSGISSNKQSYYQSVYTNHLKYKFNSKLDLNVDLNFVNFGTATYKSGIEFEGNNDNTSKILPDFQLNYRPSENMNIIIEYKQYGSNNYFSRNR
ncbi:MAG: hypothetical protein K8R49_04150 [Candidatus Cloacimonetes bacterium]|nr:hypothetical protein [Candidatus Cloacimonadota bacterium]